MRGVGGEALRVQHEVLEEVRGELHEVHVAFGAAILLFSLRELRSISMLMSPHLNNCQATRAGEITPLAGAVLLRLRPPETRRGGANLPVKVGELHACKVRLCLGRSPKLPDSYFADWALVGAAHSALSDRLGCPRGAGTSSPTAESEPDEIVYVCVVLDALDSRHSRNGNMSFTVLSNIRRIQERHRCLAHDAMTSRRPRS